MQIDPISAPAPAARASERAAVAANLERAFLEEMLKYAGPSAMEGAFSGGSGEDQFQSFLTREHAAALSDRLDLGFARMIGGAA